MFEPLNLRAVEAEARYVESTIQSARSVMLAEKTLALLAHARALRAVLTDIHEANLRASHWLNFEYRDTPMAQRVAAVLAQAHV